MSPPFEIPWSPYVRLVHDFHVPNHLRILHDQKTGDHALHFFVSGAGWCLSGGEKIPIQPGMLFLVRPGEGYHMHFDQCSDVHMYNIRFDLEDVPEFICPHPAPVDKWQQKLVLPDNCFPHQTKIKNTDGYCTIFLHLLTVWEQANLSGLLATKGLMLQILSFVSGQEMYHTRTGEVLSIAKLNKIMHKYSLRNGQPPTPEMLATDAGMSRSSFYRHFRQLTGKSIHRYLLEQRILNARIDLLHTTDTLKAIAERHGFSSIHHFTKVFCRETGTPPGNFRKQHTATR